MAEPYLGEIRLMAFNFPPQGWAQCNGQHLPINQNQALFALLGTTYGGNGQTTFALPDLRGRVPIHAGAGFYLGQGGGVEAVALNAAQTAHAHAIRASSGAGTESSPIGHYPAASQARGLAYAATADATLAADALSSHSVANGGQPHSNLQPSLVISFCIALQGIFPSAN